MPESLLVRREVVRLERADDADLVLVEATDRGRGPLGVAIDNVPDPLFLGAVDRELGVFPGVLVVLGDEFVDEVVERRTDIVNEFPDYHSKHGVGSGTSSQVRMSHSSLSACMGLAEY